MTITAEELEFIRANPGAPLLSKDGACRLIYVAGDNEFVMSGPTGRHSLFSGATDINKLNAHWAVFIDGGWSGGQYGS